MIAILSMLLSVFLFSIYPLLAAFGLKSGDPVLFVLMAHFFCAISSFFMGSFLFRKKYPKQKKLSDTFKLNKRTWIYVFLTGSAAAIAHTCFMFSLLKTSKIGATIIYETWPILAIWLTPLLVVKAWDKIRRVDYIFGFLAIIGAAFVVSADSKDMIANFDMTAIQDIEPDRLLGYFLAAIGSIGVALSTVLRGSVSQFFTTRFDNNIMLSACFSSALTRLAALPVFLITFAVLHTNGMANIHFGDVWLAALVGVTVYMGGSLFYTYGFLKTSNANIHILYYLAPVLSIIWLQFFGLSHINDFVILGTLFVITANLLVTIKAEHSYSYTSSILVLLFGGTYCYFTIGQELDNFYEAVSFTSIFYAILVSFAWDRVITRSKQEENLNLNIAYHIEDLRLSTKKKDEKPMLKFIKAVKHIMRISDREQIGALYKKLLKMRSDCNTALYKKIYQDVDQLILSKLRDVMLSEIVLLSLIGGMTVFGLVVYRPNSLWADMAAVVMSAAVIFIFFAIFDQLIDRKRNILNDNKDHLCEINEALFQSKHQFNLISIVLIVIMLSVFIGLFLYKHGSF